MSYSLIYYIYIFFVIIYEQKTNLNFHYEDDEFEMRIYNNNINKSESNKLAKV